MRRGCCVLVTVRNDPKVLRLSRDTWPPVSTPTGELAMPLGP